MRQFLTVTVDGEEHRFQGENISIDVTVANPVEEIEADILVGGVGEGDYPTEFNNAGDN